MSFVVFNYSAKFVEITKIIRKKRQKVKNYLIWKLPKKLWLPWKLPLPPPSICHLRQRCHCLAQHQRRQHWPDPNKPFWILRKLNAILAGPIVRQCKLIELFFLIRFVSTTFTTNKLLRSFAHAHELVHSLNNDVQYEIVFKNVQYSNNKWVFCMKFIKYLWIVWNALCCVASLQILASKYAPLSAQLIMATTYPPNYRDTGNYYQYNELFLKILRVYITYL